MEFKTFDVIIIGAGPAGCACAFMLRHSNLKIAVLDASQFPRDKICGDALSADVVNQLHLMDASLLSKFEGFERKHASNGVRFFAPNGTGLDIDFVNKKHPLAAGYVAQRMDFDAFLVNQIRDQETIDIFENHKVISISDHGDSIELQTEHTKFSTLMLVGADGANSIVKRQLTDQKLDKRHHCAGLRQYYENVKGFKENGSIELHFHKDILPGYFWIFPLPDNKANVGLGMLSSEVSKKNIDLKKKLEHIITEHPTIKERFKNARALEKIKGFGLPIGSKKVPLSGNRFLLLGDAANLIDPFTGEGIGNAIRSGRVAAEHLQKTFERKDFSSKFNKAYDQEIYRRMWNELRIGRSLQKLLKFPKLFNFVVKKANHNPSLKLLLTSMLDDIDMKKELTKPSFYFKLLFK